MGRHTLLFLIHSLHWKRKIHRMKMKLAFLLGLLSVTMVMGKMAKFAEMAKMTEMAEDSRDQGTAAERMNEEDAMEKRASEQRQYFLINKMVDCEEAAKLCQSQGAQLATVKSFHGPESQERGLFTKYLESQYDSLSGRFRDGLLINNKPWFFVWIGGSSDGSSSGGSSSDRMPNSMLIAEKYEASGRIGNWYECKSKLYPVCEKRPTTAPPMTTTTPTVAPPKVPGDSSKEFKLWGLFKCDGEWTSRGRGTCEDYQRNEWCKQNGDYGDGWILKTYNLYDDWADTFGRTALVCPQCGCGKYGEYDQFFVIWKKAEGSEKAKEMCEARDAKLANVIPRNGENHYSHRWSAERKLLKRYLQIQSKALQNSFGKEIDINHYWVGPNLMMFIYGGNETDSKRESGYIHFHDQDSYGLPVCRIKQADFDN